MGKQKLSRYQIAERFDAVIFDLDGVVTQTARVHAQAWKRMFDRYLQQRAEREDEDFRPFDVRTDYPEYVDGVPRYDGVRNFLQSRGIHLPEGDPSDSPERETICGLGNRKNENFREVLETDGVDVYQTTIDFIHFLRDREIKTAIISASRNCKAVLQVAAALGLFDARVDGVVQRELGIRGKPAPDVFVEASRRVGASPEKSVVVEDAVPGVRAGREGGFGLVIGVDRTGRANHLAQYADFVIKDLGEL